MQFFVGSRLSLILEWLDRESKGFLILVAVLLDILIGILDHLTGYEVAFSIFYLIPIFVISRCKGKIEGPIICLVCAITWLATDLMGGRDYSHIWIPYWNASVRLAFFLLANSLLVSIRRSMDTLEEISTTDSLTGAANPRGFRDRAQMELDRALRYKNTLTLAYLDVDDFKEINDRFGHTEGDKLLARLAELISQNIRKTDTLGRLGGDEFAILFPQTEHNFAQEIMNRIKEILSEEMRLKGWPVTFSIGVVAFEAPPSSVDEMIRRADGLMYSAKRNGKNILKFAIYSGGD